MLFFPERVAVTGVLVYLMILLLSPIEVVFPISWGSLGYIALSYLAFFAGCLLLVRGKHYRVVSNKEVQFKRSTFWIVAVIGTIGMALRIYDKYVIRGAGLGSSAMDVRELLEYASAGPLSALGGLLYPFCYLPLIILWTRSADNNASLLTKWIAIVLFAFPVLDALLLLSRSQMIVAFSMLLFAASCVLYRGKLFHRRLVLPVLLGMAVLIVVSIIAFIIRLNQMNMDPVFSIYNSVYGYVVTPNAWAWGVMNDTDSASAVVLTRVLPILQYYVHGLFEFGLLWESSDNQSFTFGAQHFAPYLKMLSIFGFKSDLGHEVYYRTGVFTTFFGPLWTDFGWFGPPLMYIFGVVCKYVSIRARQGQMAAMPLYIYLCVVIIFMPVVNFLISAQGMYLINAFAIFWLISRRWSYARNI